MSFIKFHCAYCWKDTCECTDEEQKKQEENITNNSIEREPAKIPLEAFDIFKKGEF